MRSSSKKRGHFFAIDAQDLLEQYLIQNGIFALSGLEMSFKSRGMGRHATFSCPSVDRIYSDRGYAPGNIQMLLNGVNSMKSNTPQDIFVQVCKAIADKNLPIAGLSA